ncbi:hypothetical protein EVAR_5096_1 [Eumeta japonica]|uniref:Uncharacterized protein n=1 Tax=Eumeta variegata TaxID=151549 RepID=A0A4C1SUF8_EUMVA|nr:hypothetical protein EVAR_5096_1 [Eumeta japonica]
MGPPSVTKIQFLSAFEKSKADSALGFIAGRPLGPGVDPVRGPERRHYQRYAQAGAEERRKYHRPFEYRQLHAKRGTLIFHRRGQADVIGPSSPYFVQENGFNVLQNETAKKRNFYPIRSRICAGGVGAATHRPALLTFTGGATAPGAHEKETVRNESDNRLADDWSPNVDVSLLIH